MEDKLERLLEEYTIGQVLEMLDLTEQETMEYLIETGFISWAKLTDEIQLPVS
jgi:hypothetical protein